MENNLTPYNQQGNLDKKNNIILRTFNLYKSYLEVNALNNLSFSLNKGEIFGLVGPNGAGKTTLLKVLATIIKPDDGTAEIDGINLEATMDIRKIIGYTPDVLGVYDELLVSEYLEFFIRAYYMEKGLHSFILKETMEIVGISEMADKPVEGLSRGMKQRISLARALVHNPKLLLLDEPANGLDPFARIELREILTSLRQKGVTILISSHVLNDLSDMCDRIGIMQAGNITHIDKTENLLSSGDGLKMRLRVSDRSGDAISILKELPEVTSVMWDGKDITFYFKEERKKLSDITRTLFLREIPVSTIQVEDSSLENAYIDITSRKGGSNE